ncbi:hypothetical protein CR513_44201, partial [Mucuna pruriens]
MTRTRNQSMRCFNYNEPHVIKECLIRGVVCFKCQKPGYMARDYHELEKPKQIVNAKEFPSLLLSEENFLEVFPKEVANLPHQ